MTVASAQPMTHLRLTKRGRRVLTILAAVPVVTAALVFTLNGGMATATDVAGNTKFEYVTVAAGESLWQIAGQIAPSADPRDVISDVVHLNQLAGPDLQAGQRLAIPTQYSH
jgi:LysM repeat protein